MRIYRNRLRPLPADPKAYNHAKELAKSWRKTGLTVDLVESGYPFHSPNSGRLADILGVMMEW